jgi:hypothetical protein
MMPQKIRRRRSERRGRPRADARLSMRLEGAPVDGTDPHLVTESQNISSSGVYCTSSRFLAPLSKIALTIVLPRSGGGASGQELIKCEGIVVRCQPVPKKGERLFELACMFSGLDEKRRGMLEDFVTLRNLRSLRAAASRATKAARKNGRAPATPARRTRAATAARKAAPKTSTRRRTVH